MYKVALNGLSNVYTYNVALGTKEGEVDAFVPDLTSFNFPSAIRVLDQFGPDKAAKEANLRYEPRQETLTVRPLDNFKFGKRISLIKIDVEFMEWHVVRGARQTIKQNQPLIWVENEAYFDDPANLTFVNTMYSDLGYVCNPVARLPSARSMFLSLVFESFHGQNPVLGESRMTAIASPASCKVGC